MNYLQTTYNHDTGEIETSIKAKYASNRTKFDILNNVNQSTIDRQNKQELLDSYKISTANKKDYTVTLDINGTPVAFKFIPQNVGLLDKDFTSKDITISNFNFQDIDLQSIKNRERLISRQKLSDK